MITAIKIDPNKRVVEEIQVSPEFMGSNGMYRAMGCETIETYPLKELRGDILILDEEGGFKGNKVKHWTFKHGQYQDFSGIALVVGDGGENYTNTKIEAKEIWEQIVFVD